MKKNQIIVDLGDIKLNDKQRSSLQSSIHNTVVKKLKGKQVIAHNVKETSNGKPEMRITTKDMHLENAIAGATQTAKINVVFEKTNPGDSELTATFNGISQSVQQSGTITFDKVESGDTIFINVDSLGKTNVKIDIDATPKELNFNTGSNGAHFSIN